MKVFFPSKHCDIQYVIQLIAGDVSAPYVCTTLIDKISYGQASSVTKKQAKQLAGMQLCVLLYILMADHLVAM